MASTVTCVSVAPREANPKCCVSHTPVGRANAFSASQCCQWCRSLVEGNGVSRGDLRFCDKACLGFATEGGVHMIDGHQSALRPPANDALASDFLFRTAQRLPFALLRSDLSSQTASSELRKMEAVFARLPLDGCCKDTILMWFTIGPFLFYWKDDVVFDDESQRVHWERGAFDVMVKYAFHARSGLCTLAGVPMHLEIARPVTVGSQLILARSFHRMYTCEARGGTLSGPSARGVKIDGVTRRFVTPMREATGKRADGETPLELIFPISLAAIVDPGELRAANVFDPSQIDVGTLIHAAAPRADPMDVC